MTTVRRHDPAEAGQQVRPGLGVPCSEAQADGVPCDELRDCAECEEREGGVDRPTPAAS